MKLGWTSLGTFACAASANALNQVYEIANDARMERTKRRPLPTGRLSRGHALLFAGLAGSAGIYILATQVTSHSCDADRKLLLQGLIPDPLVSLTYMRLACGCPDTYEGQQQCGSAAPMVSWSPGWSLCAPAVGREDLLLKTLHAATGELHNCSIGRSQHWALRGRVHSAEGCEHCQHMGGRSSGRHSATHGLGCCRRPARPRSRWAAKALHLPSVHVCA